MLHRLLLYYFYYNTLLLGLPGLTTSFISDYAPGFVEEGECSNVTSIDHFNFSKYSGRWYHILMIPNAYQHAQNCSRDFVNPYDEGLAIRTEGLDVYGNYTSQVAVVSNATSDERSPGLQVSSVGVPLVPYVIVDTDYRTYSCVYSCFGLFYLKAELFWVFARTLEDADSAINNCKKAFDGHNIDSSRLRLVEQTQYCDNIDDLALKALEMKNKVQVTTKNYETELQNPVILYTDESSDANIPQPHLAEEEDTGVVGFMNNELVIDQDDETNEIDSQSVVKVLCDDLSCDSNKTTSLHSLSVLLILSTFISFMCRL